MTLEDKELLLKDLSARLPYGIVINTGDKDLKLDKQHQCIGVLYPEDCSDEFNERNNNASFYITISGCYYGEEIKPYLRPMSSMTEEERKELEKITYHTFEYKKGERDIWTKSYHKNYLFDGAGELYGAGEPINMLCSSELCTKLIDWLNMHHFDYRHLIERGLALKAKEGMYKK